MKITFVVNNKNNRLAKVLPRLDTACRQAGLDGVQFLQTLRKKHAIELARQAAENGCDYLIAVGGDGTLNEVVNGLFRSKLPVNEYPTIGLLPYGSANDFAKTIQASKSIEVLASLIRSKTIGKIDLGKIILHDSGETRYFLNIAGIGLSAEVVGHMERAGSFLGPKLNYFINILRGFLTYRKKIASCQATTWQWSGKLLQLALANGRSFGHGICIAPDAAIADGQFQAAIFGDLRIWDYLKNIARLKKGLKIDLPQVQYQEASNVLIESEAPLGIEADGEYVGTTPATLSVLPKAIRFLIPPDRE